MPLEVVIYLRLHHKYLCDLCVLCCYLYMFMLYAPSMSCVVNKYEIQMVYIRNSHSQSIFNSKIWLWGANIQVDVIASSKNYHWDWNLLSCLALYLSCVVVICVMLHVVVLP